MSPALKGANLAALSGSRAHARIGGPSRGEVVVRCPRDTCNWTTIRPEYGAWSAGEAHRLHHAKGWINPDGTAHVVPRLVADPNWCGRKTEHPMHNWVGSAVPGRRGRSIRCPGLTAEVLAEAQALADEGLAQ